jgi:hypothetical protein
MKRKFTITEVVTYEVEAESAGKAMSLFLNSDDVEGNGDPCARFPYEITEREIETDDDNPAKVGDNVNVDAHGEHEEDFSGVVVGNDGHGVIMVKAPDGETYHCDANYVYVPTTGEPEPPGPAHEGCGCGFMHEGLCDDD